MDYRSHIDVSAAPETVFAFVSDERALARWRDGLIAVRRLDVGTEPFERRYAETLATPLGATTVTVVVSQDPERRELRFAVVDGPVRPRGTLAVRASDAGSRLTYRIELPTLLPIATGLDRTIFAALVKNVDRSLARLAAIDRAGFG